MASDLGTRSANGHPEAQPFAPRKSSCDQETFSPLASSRAVAFACVLVTVFELLESSTANMRTVLFEEGVQDGPKGHETFHQFESAGALTMLQFVFMSAIFLLVWRSTSTRHIRDAVSLDQTIWDWRWGALVASHIFSTFLMQSLIMPRDVMSLSTFALTKSLEVPFAAGLRIAFPGLSQKRLNIVATVAIANFFLYYAFLRMQGCVCIWAGHGLQLEGSAFYVIYFLLILSPAANAFLQESIANDLRIHPLLILASQSGIAAVVFSPVLLFQSTRDALWLLVEYREMALLAFWIVLQSAGALGVFSALIHNSDAFWAASLRGFRVVTWWLEQLVAFYISSGGAILSVVNPEVASWSLLMMLGCCLIGAAIFADAAVTAEQLSVSALRGKGTTAKLQV